MKFKLFDDREKNWGRARERKTAEIRERNWIFFSPDLFLYNEALFIHALKFLSHK